jgi:hypothetical protein
MLNRIHYIIGALFILLGLYAIICNYIFIYLNKKNQKRGVKKFYSQGILLGPFFVNIGASIFFEKYSYYWLLVFLIDPASWIFLFSLLKSTETHSNAVFLSSGNSWEITAPENHVAFLSCLPELCPNDSIMYMEVTYLGKDVKKILSSIQIDGKLEISKGTIWPKSEIFHIPLTYENIHLLLKLLENHVTNEFVDHFHIYSCDKIFLTWYDAFSKDPLFISKQIPVVNVEKFCENIGSQLKNLSAD